MDTNENDKNSASSISSDLIRGHINTIILRTLYDGDKYGYEIINEIEEKSRHQYSLKQPTLYSALKRLESQDYITSYWGGASAGGRRKYFQITEKGRKIVEQNLAEWEYSRTVIDSLISQKDYDFNNPPPTGGVDFNVLKKTTTRVPIIKGEDEDDYDFSDFEGSREEEENNETYTTSQQDTASDRDAEVISAEQEATQADESLSREDLNGISGGYSPVSTSSLNPNRPIRLNTIRSTNIPNRLHRLHLRHMLRKARPSIRHKSPSLNSRIRHKHPTKTQNLTFRQHLFSKMRPSGKPLRRKPCQLNRNSLL